MAEDRFEAVDRYIEKLFIPSDPALDAVLKSTVDRGMPEIQLSPPQAKFLYLLTKLMGARRVLELGTLAGYSTIWLARALPVDGKLVTLESDRAHAETAAENIRRAGLSAKVEIVIGKALTLLPVIAARREQPFDLVLLDADKENLPAYLKWSLKLTRKGSLIVADNVIGEGQVLKAEGRGSSMGGVHAFNQALAADNRLEAVILQQVGIKGHDGLAFAVVK